jgi:hypothetical protein
MSTAVTYARMTDAPGYTRESACAERRVRHKASRLGYRIHKSRKAFGIDNYGQFMLIEMDGDTCVLGPRFNATLSQIEEWLSVRNRP